LQGSGVPGAHRQISVDGEILAPADARQPLRCFLANCCQDPSLIYGLLLTLKCSAGRFCALCACMAHCTSSCAFGGLCAEVLLAARARQQREGMAGFLVAASAVAALTGLLGCFVGGVTGC
jgi:hypothetical protein